MKRGDLIKKDLTGKKGKVLKVFKRHAEVLVEWSKNIFTIEKLSEVSEENKESIIKKHY